MSFNKQLNWAVLGTGVIANEMAQALQNMGKNYMLLAIVHIVKPSILLKNMASKKFTMIFKISSLTLM